MCLARSQYMLTVIIDTVRINTITASTEVIANLSLFDPGAGS